MVVTKGKIFHASSFTFISRLRFCFYSLSSCFQYIHIFLHSVYISTLSSQSCISPYYTLSPKFCLSRCFCFVLFWGWEGDNYTYLCCIQNFLSCILGLNSLFSQEKKDKKKSFHPVQMQYPSAWASKYLRQHFFKKKKHPK